MKNKKETQAIIKDDLIIQRNGKHVVYVELAEWVVCIDTSLMKSKRSKPIVKTWKKEFKSEKLLAC